MLVTSTENYFTTNSEQFSSVPTTVKTYENDTVLLPCYTVGKFVDGGGASASSSLLGISVNFEADIIMFFSSRHFNSVKLTRLKSAISSLK